MERVMLTLPADLLEAVDMEAQKAGQNRSQAVREALREWLEEKRRGEFEALLAEGYQATAREMSVVVEELSSAQYAAAQAVWHWDE